MIPIRLNRLEEIDSKMNEAYKQLRTNVIFSGVNMKAIAVTGCTEGEGKSEVSFNLSRSLAEAGNKVVYVDADIRKSVAVSRYAPDRTVNGLSHYLAGREKLDNIVCQTNIHNLYMVFAGVCVPNSSELLGSARFPAMLSGLKKVFDYIIIDCPPLGMVIDAAVIAQYADGAIMVIENNKISYKVAQKVKAQLSKSGCKILGAVLNKVSDDRKGYYGQYSEYYGRAE